MIPNTTKDALANDTKAGVVRMKDEFRQTANDIRDDLESAAGRAGRSVRRYIDTAGTEISHAAETVTTQIRNKPVQSSVLALAAGFVLGALLRR